MKTVFKEQIERLYKFTRQHYVEYYDVQTELVDHLANAIEARWTENPDEDFEKALQREFAKFGVFGFGEVVEKRESAMRSRYFKLMWKAALNFVKLPKVILTGSAVFVLALVVFHFSYGPLLLILILAAQLLFGLVWMVKKSIAIKKERKKNTGKLYLLDRLLTIPTIGGIEFFLFFMLVNLPLFFTANNSYQELSGHFWLSGLFALLFVAVTICNIIAFKILPNKKEKILQDAYPERKFD